MAVHRTVVVAGLVGALALASGGAAYATPPAESFPEAVANALVAMGHDAAAVKTERFGGA